MKIENMEEWKNIEGYETYQVSSLGRVKNIKTGRILRIYYNPLALVKLSRRGVVITCSVAQLVAKAFLDIVEGKRIASHIDGDMSNNAAENLRWTTLSEVVSKWRKRKQ